jgi:tetratricopeptide (TPR) repeat protein
METWGEEARVEALRADTCRSGNPAAGSFRPVNRFGHLEFDASLPSRSASLHPPVTDEVRCVTEAETAFGRGEFESALRWYGKVLEYNPTSGGAWVGQVKCLIELGQYKEANVWADKALERFPEAPELLAAKAVALGRMGRPSEAMPFSDAAMEKPGEIAWVWLARGDVLLASGQKQVDACFDRALRLAPGDWLVRWLAGRIRAYWKQFALALKHVREAVSLAPDRPSVWISMAECQLALGLADAARQSVDQALSLSPEHPAALELLRGIDEQGWLGQVGGTFRRWLGRSA